MKIVLLSGASSIHTVRWANALSIANYQVHVISQQPVINPFKPAVQVHLLPYRGVLGYFTMVPFVRRLLHEIKPDIINAHYASGYGTTARLVNYRPWVLSVWGSDVYDFPHKSPLHKWLIKKNLSSADKIASTSRCMGNETRSLVSEKHDIAITPFGVDMSAYEDILPIKPEKKLKLTIGTIKTMTPTYGIDTLLKAFAILLQRSASWQSSTVPELELRLVGGGTQITELQALAKQLGIADIVTFVGPVLHSEVPVELSKLDIYVALSRLESFGVAIIEAGAAGRPVVVSDVGGLPEVTIDGETGFVVPRENPEAAADALEKLVLNANLRYKFGIAAKQHVERLYSWDACVNTMLRVYEQTIRDYKKDSSW